MKVDRSGLVGRRELDALMGLVGLGKCTALGGLLALSPAWATLPCMGLNVVCGNAGLSIPTLGGIRARGDCTKMLPCGLPKKGEAARCGIGLTALMGLTALGQAVVNVGPWFCGMKRCRTLAAGDCGRSSIR